MDFTRIHLYLSSSSYLSSQLSYHFDSLMLSCTLSGAALQASKNFLRATTFHFRQLEKRVQLFGGIPQSYFFQPCVLNLALGLYVEERRWLTLTLLCLGTMVNVPVCGEGRNPVNLKSCQDRSTASEFKMNILWSKAKILSNLIKILGLLNELIGQKPYLF